MFTRRLISIIAMAGVVSIPAFAGDFSEQAQVLADLRLQVTLLEADMKETLLTFQSRVRSLETQRSDLELQIRRDQTQIDHLNTQITEMQGLLSPSQQQAELAQSLTLTMAQIKLSILNSLPYRTDERLASLTEIEQLMSTGELSAGQATVRVWNLLEDEKRLNRENSIDKATIQFAGESVLVEVARIGMVALYCMTAEGRFGYASKNGEQWEWVEVTDANQQDGLRTLFTDLQKGVRTGAHILPNAFVNN